MPDVMTIAEVAERLGCRNPAAVLRVISRGGLKATLLPGDAGYRVLEDDLAAFVGSGAPDLAGPPEEKLLAYVEAFERAIWGAMTFLTDAQIKQRAGDLPSGTLFNAVMPFSPAVRAVVDGPIPKLPFDLPGNRIRDRYARWGDLYLANMLRHYVKEATERAGLKWGGGLYSGESNYSAIVIECWKLALAQKLTNEQKAQPDAPSGPVYTIRYELPVSSFANQKRLETAAALAF